MGGIIIVAAIAIPFLILSEYDWRAVGVFGAAIALRAARLHRRLRSKIVHRRSLGLDAPA